jgi:hypothetical protein
VLGRVQDRGSEFGVGGEWRGSPSSWLANEREEGTDKGKDTEWFSIPGDVKVLGTSANRSSGRASLQ